MPLITHTHNICGFRHTITRCVDCGALTSKGVPRELVSARGTPTIGQLVVCHPPDAWSSESPSASSITPGVRGPVTGADRRGARTAASHMLVMGERFRGQPGDRAVAEQALRRPRAVRDPLTPSVATDSPGQGAAIMIRRPATSRRTVCLSVCSVDWHRLWVEPQLRQEDTGGREGDQRCDAAYGRNVRGD